MIKTEVLSVKVAKGLGAHLKKFARKKKTTRNKLIHTTLVEISGFKGQPKAKQAQKATGPQEKE